MAAGLLKEGASQNRKHSQKRSQQGGGGGQRRRQRVSGFPRARGGADDSAKHPWPHLPLWALFSIPGRLRRKSRAAACRGCSQWPSPTGSAKVPRVRPGAGKDTCQLERTVGAVRWGRWLRAKHRAAVSPGSCRTILRGAAGRRGWTLRGSFPEDSCHFSVGRGPGQLLRGNGQGEQRPGDGGAKAWRRRWK